MTSLEASYIKAEREREAAFNRIFLGGVALDLTETAVAFCKEDRVLGRYSGNRSSDHTRGNAANAFLHNTIRRRKELEQKAVPETVNTWDGRWQRPLVDDYLGIIIELEAAIVSNMRQHGSNPDLNDDEMHNLPMVRGTAARIIDRAMFELEETGSV